MTFKLPYGAGLLVSGLPLIAPDICNGIPVADQCSFVCARLEIFDEAQPAIAPERQTNSAMRTVRISSVIAAPWG
jgi:hypothetical protein